MTCFHFCRNHLAATLLLAPAVLGGCAVGPNYERPDSKLADDFSEPAYSTTQPTAVPSRTVSGTSPIVQWWTTFHDPQLDKLVDRAVASNLNLKVATARVREARGAAGRRPSPTRFRT